MADPLEAPVKSPCGSTSNAVDANRRALLSNLMAQATLKYSVKNYNVAAELYSQATELQAELNGEMSSQNADLLYAYGRCLYNVAVRNNDVLGTKVAGEKREEGTKNVRRKKQEKEKKVDEVETPKKLAEEEVLTNITEKKDKEVDAGGEQDKDSKPFFQFTGDENFDTSDEEEDTMEASDEEGAVDDDNDEFINAYEVLDLARVLLLKRLQESKNEKGKGKVSNEPQSIKQLKERLADTYDLQAEISLEGERFPNAVVDLKAALVLKEELFPQESSLIAEAHYKLSLALEFSSVTRQREEDGDVEAEREAHVDEAMREDAAKQMEAAIASCKLRIQQEEARLDMEASKDEDTGKPKITKENIDEVKEMIKDMEQRVNPLLGSERIAEVLKT